MITFILGKNLKVPRFDDKLWSGQANELQRGKNFNLAWEYKNKNLKMDLNEQIN